MEGVLGSDDKMILEKEEAASEKQTKAELSQEGREREKSGQCRRPSLPSAAALSSYAVLGSGQDSGKHNFQR